MINDFITNFKKSTIKISAEEAKNLKQQIKDDKKSKNKIITDLKNIRKTVVRKTQARMTHLKNFNLNKDKVSEIVKSSKENTPIAIIEEEITFSPNLLKMAKTTHKLNEGKSMVRITEERITTFGGGNDEDYNDIDEDKYINNVNIINQNPSKSATKSKCLFD